MRKGAIYIKIRNNKLYFSTPASYDTRYRDLIIINPNEYTIELYDLKKVLENTIYSSFNK